MRYTPPRTYMKLTILSIMMLALACGNSQKASDPSVLAASRGGDKAAATTGTPIECAKEVARVCPDGLVDGCSNSLTTHHECVAADAHAGQPCAQEVAMVCPEGQVDLCLAGRAYTPAAHLCIVK